MTPASGSTSSSRWPGPSTARRPPWRGSAAPTSASDAEASEEVLLDEARRYWLSDKLMLPTEANAHPTDGFEGGPAPRGDDPAAPTRR